MSDSARGSAQRVEESADMSASTKCESTVAGMADSRNATGQSRVIGKDGAPARQQVGTGLTTEVRQPRGAEAFQIGLDKPDLVVT